MAQWSFFAFAVILNLQVMVSHADYSQPEYCLQPSDSGPCEAATARWFYNQDTHECEEFTYGGCQGNQNNFESQDLCEQACQSECGIQMCMVECPSGFKLDEQGCTLCECQPELGDEEEDELHDEEEDEVEGEECGIQMCMVECPNGFKLDERGCTLCECQPEMVQFKDKCEEVTCDESLECRVFTLTMSRHEVARCVDPSMPDECVAPMDGGPCKANKPRWYYNPEKQACEEFMYGGCRGNTNNFESESVCQSSCIEMDGKSGKNHECSNRMCMMHCEDGFKKDTFGCDLCECNDLCPQDTVCGLVCRHGFKKDEQGCSLCECRDRPPCLKDIVCAMECRYGFVVRQDGCQLCECQKEPCAAVTCGNEEKCQNVEVDGSWTGECVSLHELKPWCGLEMCAMHCEHGFTTDRYGCAQCECLDSLPLCTQEECDDEQCQYGLSYNSNGCRTCECLPSPCELDTCPLSEACEVKVTEDCHSCPAQWSCLAPDEVKRVSVSLRYFFEDPEEMDEEELKELQHEFHSQLTNMLGIRADTLKGLKIAVPSEASVSVTFHLVSYSGNNLVTLYEKFKNNVELHTDDSQVIYESQTLVPEHATLTAQYHSDMAVPGEGAEGDGGDGSGDDSQDMTQTITIVAAAVGGFIALTVIVVILVAIIRTKTKNKGSYQKHKNNKNAIYKKAPVSEEA